MKPLLLALALFALPCAANVITFVSSKSVSVPIVGPNEVSGSNTFIVPQFNPSLGTLNSISFDLTVGAQLLWEEISRPVYANASLDFHVNTEMSALGVHLSHSEGPVFGRAGLVPCNVPEFPAPCTELAKSNTSDFGGVGIVGTINGQAATVSGAAGINSMTGALIPTLSEFTGMSTVDVPVALTFNAWPQGPYIGGLWSTQTLGSSLYWAYDYSPTQHVDSAVTPEPRLAWLALLAMAWLVNKSRGHKPQLPAVVVCRSVGNPV